MKAATAAIFITVKLRSVQREKNYVANHVK